jgi:hypothetical protein
MGELECETEQRIPRGLDGFGEFAQIRPAQIREIRQIRVEFFQ